MPPLPWRTRRPVDPDTSYVVTVTKLPLRTHLRTPRIMRATWRTVHDLRHRDGLVGYALKADILHKTFWTMSAWTDSDAQAAFVRSDVHRNAMAALQPYLDRVRVETFNRRGADLPMKWADLARNLTAAAASHPATTPNPS